MKINISSNVFFCLALVAAGLAVYSGSFGNSFHFDDMPSIVHNRAIRDWRDLKAIWDFWPSRFLTTLSFAINFGFGGLSVEGYHAVNLTIHVAAGLLVFYIAKLLFSLTTTGNQKDAPDTGFVSFFCSLLFICHPVQTQAVTYIVQRATCLSGSFYMASVYGYVRHRIASQGEWPSGEGWYRLSLLAGLAAVFSKETAVTLPLSLWLVERFFFEKPKKLFLKRLVPFLIAALLVPAVYAATRSFDMSKMARHIEDAPAMSAWEYLLTQFKTLLIYGRLLIVPIGQNFDHDVAVAGNVWEPAVLGGILVLGLCLWAAGKLYGKNRLISFAILWFFVLLLPESSLFPIKDVIYEHRLYLPVAAFAIVLVCLIRGTGKRSKSAYLIITMTVIVTAFGALAFRRNIVWRDEFTLWNDAVSRSPHKARPYFFRGLAYENLKGDYELAMRDYTVALTLLPTYYEAYNNRGNVFQRKGDLESALRDYNRALEINPGYADAYNDRGVVYGAAGLYTKAIKDFDKAVFIDQYFGAAYFNRSFAYYRLGDPKKALEDLDKAIHNGLQPDPSYLKKLKELSSAFK